MRVWTLECFVAVFLVSACGDDGGPKEDPTDECTATLSPGADDQTAVQIALIESVLGDTLCFEAGTYSFVSELSLSTSGVTLRGIGDTRDDVIWDFSGQNSGGNGLSVTGNDFLIEHITVRDTPGDGIRVADATGVTMRDIKVEWTGGPATENGAYGLYPVGCTDVLIEDCVVSGASDAGIYVGQSVNIAVRRNEAFDNVAGIEIENSIGAEVYENNTHDNTGGILIFALPDLPKKECKQVLVRDNNVANNNLPNFADPSSIVASVPVGSGVLIIAADEVEVHSNTIVGHNSFGLVSVSWVLMERLGVGSTTDTEYDQYSEAAWIHGNTMSGNGTAPDTLALLFEANPVEDIVFDGYVDASKDDTDGALRFCVSDLGTATFRMADAPGDWKSPVTDISAYTCTHPAIPGVDL